MAIGTALAILGSAAIGAVASSSAAHSAASASQNATNQTIDYQRQRDAQIRADEQPFVQPGIAAVNALSSRLGLTPSAPATGQPNALSGTPSGIVTGQPGAASYSDRAIALPEGVTMTPNKGVVDPASVGPRPSLEGQPTGPGLGPATIAGEVPVLGYNPNGPGVSVPPGQVAPGAPNALSGSPTAPGVGSQPLTSTDPGTFGNATNPTFTPPTYQPPPEYQAATFDAPKPFSYTASDYTASPAYRYQVDQALKGVEGSKAAQGSLFSGDTLKALSDRAENMALSDFNNERQFAYGQYGDQRNFDYSKYLDNRNFGYGQSIDSRNFGRSTFDTDRAFNQGAYQDARNYLTGRFDTQTGNLFNLTNVGQAGVSSTNAAGQNTTNGIVNALNNNAATQGNAAIAGANATTSLLGSGINALAYTSGRSPVTWGSNIYDAAARGSSGPYYY